MLLTENRVEGSKWRGMRGVWRACGSAELAHTSEAHEDSEGDGVELGEEALCLERESDDGVGGEPAGVGELKGVDCLGTLRERSHMLCFFRSI